MPNDRWQPDVAGGGGARLAGLEGNAEGQVTIASRGGKSPLFVSDPNDDWIGADSDKQIAGDPGGMADEPVLFENPNQPRTGPSVTVDAGQRGGQRPGPWSAPGYNISGFGGNLTLGQFLNTPLSTMRFGTGYGGVGAGQVLVGNERLPVGGTAGVSPGSAGMAEVDYNDPSFAEAERVGAAETAALRERGELPPATGGGTWTAGTGTPVLNLAGQQVLNTSGVGHDNAASRATHAAILYGMSQGGGLVHPFDRPDSTGVNHLGQEFRHARIANPALYNKLVSMNQAEAQAEGRRLQEIVNKMLGNKDRWG